MRRHRGIVLIVALLLLAALSVAGVALMRSMSTTNLVVGNLAFSRSAVGAADLGIEAANVWLGNAAATDLYSDSPGNGYLASMAAPYDKPATEQSWAEFFDTTLSGTNALALVGKDPERVAGNRVTYVIQRLCSGPGAPSEVQCVRPSTSRSNCARAAAAGSCSGGAEAMAGLGADGQSAGPAGLEPPVYYRITARAIGPRNSRGDVQAIVSR